MHAGHDSPILERRLPDEAATLALGAELAPALAPGMVVWLSGDLGAGKTTLTRGLLRAFHYTGRVKSPTFTLVEHYPFSSFNLYHFDLYRFADPEEWEDAGFRDYFNERAICLVEWPERAAGCVPGADLRVRLDIDGEQRVARLSAATEVGEECMRRLRRSQGRSSQV
jgi:tRNA threonylcarbamoyladenosine biosynthesis protein TsaE